VEPPTSTLSDEAVVEVLASEVIISSKIPSTMLRMEASKVPPPRSKMRTFPFLLSSP
jgi:hypothetical protein